MRRVPLKEYKTPRILAIDFTKSEVQKIIDAGFIVKRGYSGLYDNNEYCIPTALQDIEIALIKCSQGTFNNRQERKKSKESVLDDFFIHIVIRELWIKDGWSVIFIDDSISPNQLEYLGLEDIGLGNDYGRYLSASHPLVRNHKIQLEFPKFAGETVNIEENNPGGLLMKYFASGKWILLAVKDQRIKLGGIEVSQKWIIKDDSAQQCALAIMLYSFFPAPPERTFQSSTNGQKIEVELPKKLMSGVLLLPNYENKNADIAINLINDFIYEVNPSLFSESMHKWLSDYRPEPVRQLCEQRKNIEEKLKKEMNDINKKIELEEKKYSWLDILLVGSDDDFKNSVGIALDFLGFDVKDIDKKLSIEEKKREDFNIIDPSDKSFYIVEATATKRGANKDLILKTQAHQGYYSRRNKCPTPDALLIINHSYDLDPIQRTGRFYTDPDILTLLKDQNIKAVDSIVLHSLCQRVLAGKVDKEKARRFLKNISGAISGINSI